MQRLGVSDTSKGKKIALWVIPGALLFVIALLLSIQGEPVAPANAPGKEAVAPAEAHAEEAVANKAPSPAKTIPKANIILIVVDTLRADHLGCYGYKRQTSRNIDRVAKESIVFKHSYSHTSWTHPSITSLFTGLHPKDHGVRRWNHRVPEKLLTLAEALSKNGYQTAAVATHHIFRKNHGLSQGFEHYDLGAVGDQEPDKAITSQAAVKIAIKFVEMLENKPFFLFLHLFDPHTEYHQHKDFKWGKGSDLDRYDSEIAHTDHHLGTFFDYLRDKKLMNNTLLVLTSDHGEEFRDHGGTEHGANVYEESIRVPLIMRIPGVTPATVEKRVLQTHVAPTLMSLAALPIPSAFPLKPIRILEQEVAVEDVPIFAETFLGDGVFSVIRGHHKLILNQRTAVVELYDLRADPGELKNLVKVEGARALDLRQELDTFFFKGLVAKPAKVPITDDLKAKLNSLGYINVEE